MLHANEKFPDMKALADYVHSKGLKLGIYSSPGPQTCGHYEGSYNHEQQDADLYASWGIDYLKYDLCGFQDIMTKDAPGDLAGQNRRMQAAFAKMHQAILNTGRPMVYSLSQSGWDMIWQWAPEVGANLWRTTGDIQPNFDRIRSIGRSQAGLAKYAGPDTGMIPTCSRSVMASSRSIKTASTWAIGRALPRKRERAYPSKAVR